MRVIINANSLCETDHQVWYDHNNGLWLAPHKNMGMRTNKYVCVCVCVCARAFVCKHSPPSLVGKVVCNVCLSIYAPTVCGDIN